MTVHDKLESCAQVPTGSGRRRGIRVTQAEKLQPRGGPRSWGDPGSIATPRPMVWVKVPEVRGIKGRLRGHVHVLQPLAEHQHRGLRDSLEARGPEAEHGPSQRLWAHRSPCHPPLWRVPPSCLLPWPLPRVSGFSAVTALGTPQSR